MDAFDESMENTFNQLMGCNKLAKSTKNIPNLPSVELYDPKQVEIAKSKYKSIRPKISTKSTES
jgi:hypothetical protein